MMPQIGIRTGCRSTGRWTPLLLAVLVIIAACGGDSQGSGGTSGGAESPGSDTADTAANQPRGNLTIATVTLAANLDATKQGFAMITWGIGETLTRITPERTAEPWLAETVTAVDPNTWRVTLRNGATFHDGTPVTAADVVASFQHSWETQPGANAFISKDTAVTAVDARTVEFTTPRPVGAFRNNLATFHFIIHKATPYPNIPTSTVMTGPYRPSAFEIDARVTLEAFPEHWGGPPPIATIEVRAVPDANTRALALQAGDVDMVRGLPPELLNSLPDDIEKVAAPSWRQDYVQFNHQRLPFSDRAVRQAFALGIDRTALNKIALEGLGQPATSLYPPATGVEPVTTQSTDVAQAKQVLDQAGWLPGTDGVRTKDGTRLSITLLHNMGTSGHNPALAVALQHQLKAVGFDIQPRLVPSADTVMLTGDYDAAIYSFSTMPTGDPLYLLNVALGTDGTYNYGKFTTPAMETLLDRLRAETEQSTQATLLKQAQELNRTETPLAYLVVQPTIYAYRKDKIQGFTPHPNDIYTIDTTLTVK
jgi:peptide/nickel transport system substrate-binding protein